MNKWVIEGNNLSKIYHEAHTTIEVLKNVNLHIQAGELVAIVGNSGSGKSTLLHLLGGLDHPSDGKVKIAGKDLKELSEKEKCKMRNRYLGFVYQFHHLLPDFTALENACMPLLIRGMNIDVATAKARHLLELVGLKNRLTHKMGELSGGEKQRVAIARALVTDPLCILADEPTGNLDPQNANKVLDLFIELQKNFKTSAVIVTHDKNIANKADRILTLDDAKLIAS